MDGFRTRAAKLAAAAHALKGTKRAPFSLAFMTDAARIPNPEMIARALPTGAAIILRDYDLPRREALARRLASIARARGLKLLIGADWDLAKAVEANGVHLPAWALGGARLAREGMTVSAACHHEEQIKRAGAIGADIITLSPAFPTQSHPGAGALGAQKFRALVQSAACPVLALGGVDETNAHLLSGANVCGLAAIGAFMPR